MPHQQPVQIEQTSKQWKAVQLAGGLLFLAGLAVLFAGALQGGAVVLGLGIAVTAVGKILAWWHHG
jgi:uncharacterized membrane protein HdeD (DUF308 family)